MKLFVIDTSQVIITIKITIKMSKYIDLDIYYDVNKKSFNVIV